jgi:two-component system, chemotaxis family, protein-glutamate methylesterase/glutaminase
MSVIRVLIVEDSPVAQEFLTYILTSDPDIRVAGVASNGAEALVAAKELRPSVITMDIHMPIMDGFEATRRIMETVPTPIVVVSGSTASTEVSSTFRAMEAGALAVVLRPPGIDHVAFEASSRDLILTVKLMSEVKVVRRLAREKPGCQPLPAVPTPAPMAASGIQVVAIGASTGGPPVLKAILSGITKDFSLPVLLVQHIASGFARGFTEWLAAASGFPVRIAADGEIALPGHGYVAPDGFHLGIARGPRIALSADPPESNGLRPSVGYLFRSVAQVFGSRAAGVLLTGMGRDGADELKSMRDAGAITIAQDEESSVVFGMPGEAIKLDGATYILSPDGIAALLSALSEKSAEEGP